MTKIAESLEAVYIVRFNRTTLCQHRKETMCFK